MILNVCDYYYTVKDVTQSSCRWTCSARFYTLTLTLLFPFV